MLKKGFSPLPYSASRRRRAMDLRIETSKKQCCDCSTVTVCPQRRIMRISRLLPHVSSPEPTGILLELPSSSEHFRPPKLCRFVMRLGAFLANRIACFRVGEALECEAHRAHFDDASRVQIRDERMRVEGGNRARLRRWLTGSRFCKAFLQCKRGGGCGKLGLQGACRCAGPRV